MTTPTAVYASNNGGISFSNIGTYSGITSVDVGPTANGTAILVGTNTGPKILTADGMMSIFKTVTGASETDPVYGVALSPNYKNDALLFYVTDNGTDAIVHSQWHNQNADTRFKTAALTGATGLSKVVFAFSSDYDYSANNKFLVGVTGATGDVFRVSTSASSSTVADLNISGKFGNQVP